jgi:hypothetical protein
MANPRIEELDDDVQDIVAKNDDASSESDASEGGDDSGTFEMIPEAIWTGLK